MLTLTIRTDKPEAEIGLYEDGQQLSYKQWQAHRELSDTIHKVIAEELKAISKDWPDIAGVIYFKGPGSFTGLRIGAAVANALKDGLQAQLVNAAGDDWINQGFAALKAGTNELALPEYGAEARTTQQKR